MMKKIFAIVIISLLTSHSSLSQAQDPVIMEVGGKKIHQTEFMHDFMQSVGDNLLKKGHVTAQEKRAALDEYVELYANFQAKLQDAAAMGLDTAPDMLRELEHYRADLAAPYLIDSALLSSILHEAYERNRYALHVAHILVRVRFDAEPEDTLAAYQRALELRQRVVGGEDFFNVAIEEARRNNPRAQVNPNEGELNYFSSFDMVYPFENAAYALRPGEVSQPVRTRFGYHIIKLLDRVEMYGKVTIQHFWLRNAGGKKDINFVYDQLQNGVPFEKVVRQSDDESTANTGGYIRDASMSQLPQEYIKVLSGMNEGEISTPFLTRYGWHIVKLVSKDTLPPFETMIPFYKQRMARDQRGTASRKSFAASTRQKYGIVDNTVTPVEVKGKKTKKQQPVQMKADLNEITSLLNDTVFSGYWRFRPDSIHDLRPLVSAPGKEYTAVDFGRYIRKHQKVGRAIPYDTYAKQRYEEFLDSVSIAYADSQLENEYPDFAALIDEYRKGLIIFNYNDKMIWSAAINDSTGFSDFYARESRKKSLSNPDDSIFFWRTRARTVVLNVADSLCLQPAKAVKLMRKALDRDNSSTEMQAILMKNVDSKKCQSDNPVTFTLEMLEHTHQRLLGDNQWQRGVYVVSGDKGYRILVVQDVLAPCLKEQTEARGYYLNAWQNEVEQTLCRSLHDKYNVKIDRNAVDKIRF